MFPLQQLISDVGQLIDLAKECQLSSDDAKAADLRDRYLVWFQAACQYVPDDKQDEFRNMYEGGTFVSRIRSFLEDPGKPNSLHDPNKPNPLIPPYANQVETTFASSIRRQEEILIMARESVDASRHTVALAHLATHIERLGSLVSSLGRRYGGRAPFIVADEYDLQDVLDGVLRLFDEDVEKEDFAPKLSGTGSRLDWSLRTLEVAVEAKYCRSSDSRRKVRDELLADLATFQTHPRTKAFLAVVYDREFTLENPIGFVADLERHGSDLLPTRILVIPRR